MKFQSSSTIFNRSIQKNGKNRIFFKNDIMVALAPKGSGEVIELGNSYLHILAFGYFLVGFTNTFHGFFRGMGNMTLTLVDSIINISSKVLVVYMFMNVWRFNALAVGTVAGWVLMNIFALSMFLYHKNMKWKEVYISPTKEQIEKNENGRERN